MRELTCPRSSAAENTGKTVLIDPAAIGMGCSLVGPENRAVTGAPGLGRLIAIDIGQTGAVALFDRSGALLAVQDLPTLEDGPASRRNLNAGLLAALVRRLAPAQAVVEHVAARPDEAAPGAFSFGRCRGTIEGVLAAQAIPVRFVTPAWWKRRAGIPAGREHKATARSVAIARWPDRADWFGRAKDHDRAEACLIGVAFLADLRSAGR